MFDSIDQQSTSANQDEEQISIESSVWTVNLEDYNVQNESKIDDSHNLLEVPSAINNSLERQGSDINF